MKNILKEICDRRLSDIERLGFSYGKEIPLERTRPVVPFLPEPGTILEVKRASPSKGNIAPDLNPVETAADYIAAGTSAISVLTEENYFKGSLEDLKKVAELSHQNGDKVAVLRKDFLLFPEEIEIAYKCGADAVLLIARILETDQLLKMAHKAFELGLSILLELRDEEAVLKALEVLTLAQKMNACDKVVLGVNARDLKTFTIDMLIPLKIKSQIEEKCEGMKIRVISESGVLNSDAAALTGMLGFDGILIGEAVAKNPKKAGDFVSAFVDASKSSKNAAQGSSSVFWKKIALKLNKIEKTHYRPLVKICGLTNSLDAVTAVKCGADVLGFVFEEKFARHVELSKIPEIKSDIEKFCAENGVDLPCFVAVITMPDSAEADRAREYLSQGVIDAIQFHGCAGKISQGYEALRFGNENQLEDLQNRFASGSVRILLDSYVEGVEGGSGKSIPEDLVQKASQIGKLWLAGGVTPQNTAQIVEKFRPELIDVSSGVESEPGKKDAEKIRSLFAALDFSLD